ncbi:hypothetical protein AAGS40_07940 [Paraburkholderia sp. PREW-6R]|uniref:hypothetical protein n=1 Tax=Paraburkholderia sp. PREW-6R TaxID=3141544 RepID=UPI0031F5785A
MPDKKPKDLVSQVCAGTGPCNEATLNAAIQAHGTNADAAAANIQTMGAYGAPAAALTLIGPEAVTAAMLAGGLDYSGSAYSYYAGLSKDRPSFTNSYIAGVVGGLSYPLAISGSAVSGMGTAERIVANGYNAAVAGVGAFGAAGMTGSNPDLSGGLAVGWPARGLMLMRCCQAHWDRLQINSFREWPGRCKTTFKTTRASKKNDAK